jgi:hypothetical protein
MRPEIQKISRRCCGDKSIILGSSKASVGCSKIIAEDEKCYSIQTDDGVRSLACVSCLGQPDPRIMNIWTPSHIEEGVRQMRVCTDPECEEINQAEPNKGGCCFCPKHCAIAVATMSPENAKSHLGITHYTVSRG